MIDVRLVTCAELPVHDADTPIIADACTAEGLDVDVADWRDDNVGWDGARLTLIRSPWDYVTTRDEFVAWAYRVGAVTRLWNPAPLLEWNTHKAYLLDVAARGAPIVPTVVLLDGSAASLDGICDAQGWNRVVVKPAVGIGSEGAGRFEVGDVQGQEHLDELLTRGDALVQPFVASVERDGELSVVCFDGEVSHAVRKRPGAGDYRVQEHHGGRVELVEPSVGAVELTTRVCNCLPEPTCYARVDLLRSEDAWQVIEVEATEPSLWLDLAAPAATARMVRAITARLG